MASYELDPQADVVITLQEPCAAFAVWYHTGLEENAETTKTSSSLTLPLPTNEAIDRALSVEDTSSDEPTTETLEVRAAADGELEPVDFSVRVPTCPGVGREEENIRKDTHEGFQDRFARYYVSSRHLQLASSRFASMLSSGNWQEGIPDGVDGRYHITATNWDEAALLILLNILHNRNRQAPRSVSLELLTKLAVLIDYYDCAEAIELYVEGWVGHLRQTSPVPSVFCRDLVLWMCIAWVFKLPHEFTASTRVAIQCSDYEMPTLDLPIVSCVERIYEARLEAINFTITRLHDLLERYRDLAYACPSGSNSFECGSILYGALTKEMESAGLLSPGPEAPFVGLNLSALHTRVRSIRSPLWSSSRSKSRHGCDLSKKVISIVDKAIHFAKGLQLRDLSPA